MENKENGWLTKGIIDKFKNRKLSKKQQEIEELKLEIQKAKLQKELEEIRK